MYSGNAFIGAHGLSGLFADGKDWVASYGSKPTHPWLLHQYSNGQYSPRINWKGAGYCDTNEYNGAVADLINITTGGATTAPKDEDVTEVISLKVTSQKVQKGKPCWIWWDKENSDPGKQHAKGTYPGILTTANSCNINANVYGVDGTYYFVAVNMKTKKERSVDVGQHQRNEVASVVDALYANEHLYLKFVPAADGTVSGWAKGLYWK